MTKIDEALEHLAGAVESGRDPHGRSANYGGSLDPTSRTDVVEALLEVLTSGDFTRGDIADIAEALRREA